MCIFTGEGAPRVASTRIFGTTDGETATLVYSMSLEVDSEVAMILPLPVKLGLGEAALSFVSLEEYPEFFDDLQRGFPQPVAASADVLTFAPQSLALKQLVVHTVGAFEASFVPHLRDFNRLDPRFRLSDDIWAKLPLYADYGFAVFRLTPGTDKRVHPMAFRFQTRHPDRTFFPTVHVHDGALHPTAQFDHQIYYQVFTNRLKLPWELGSFDVASKFMNESKAQGLVRMDKPVYTWWLVSEQPNRDFHVMTTGMSMGDLYRL